MGLSWRSNDTKLFIMVFFTYKMVHSTLYLKKTSLKILILSNFEFLPFLYWTLLIANGPKGPPRWSKATRKGLKGPP